MKPRKAKPHKLSQWLYYRNRLRFAIFRRDKFTCQYCGRTALDGATLELEHIFPLSRGGNYSESNLITSCHKCNNGKANYLLAECEIKSIRGLSDLFVGIGCGWMNFVFCEGERL